MALSTKELNEWASENNWLLYKVEKLGGQLTHEFYLTPQGGIVILRYEGEILQNVCESGRAD